MKSSTVLNSYAIATTGTRLMSARIAKCIRVAITILAPASSSRIS
ncbi:hypothetical protein ACFPRL_22905 [Pseudoclavibacter helvolus]